MKVGDIIQTMAWEKIQRMGIVKRIIYGIDAEDWDYLVILWANGDHTTTPKHRVRSLS